MTQEEKAKAYDEAKLRISAAYNSNRCTIGFMNEIFPELKESEDERIRKELLVHIQQERASATLKVNHAKWDRMIVWLEKQGNLIMELQKTYAEIGRLVKENYYLKEKQDEQKPIEWSEVDNVIVEGICLALEYSNESGKKIEKYENWLHSIKDKVLPQSKQEWSEEDEKKLLCICAWIKDYPRIADFKDEMYTVANNYIDWLKSLKPQPTWKPSDEQMKALKEICDEHWEPDGLDPLYMLWNQLKKLREE